MGKLADAVAAEQAHRPGDPPARAQFRNLTRSNSANRPRRLSVTERVLALSIVALVVLGLASLAKGDTVGVGAAITAIAAVLPGATRKDAD